jgi:hypothetical protein
MISQDIENIATMHREVIRVVEEAMQEVKTGMTEVCLPWS